MIKWMIETFVYNKKFTDMAVTSPSKYRTNAIQAYQWENMKSGQHVSAALEPNPNKPKNQATATSTDLTTATSLVTQLEYVNDKKLDTVSLSETKSAHVQNSFITVVVIKSNGKTDCLTCNY